jgi:hypothetical protein
MSNSTSINKCENCDQHYCQECSAAAEWQRFCTAACEKEFNCEWRKENQNEQ